MFKPYYLIFFLLLCLLNGCVEREKPPSLETRLQLGYLYLSQGDRVAAARNFERALNFAPKDPRVHIALACLNHNQGNSENAKHYYQSALNLAKGKEEFLNNYSAFLCDLGQYNKPK